MRKHCLTPGALYESEIDGADIYYIGTKYEKRTIGRLRLWVSFPSIPNLSKRQAIRLERSVHDAVSHAICFAGVMSKNPVYIKAYASYLKSIARKGR